MQDNPSKNQPNGSGSRSGSGRIYQQSVTLRAFREGGPLGEDGWFILGVTESQLPLVIGAIAGGALLVVIVLGLLLWRCCHHHQDSADSKLYCFQHGAEECDSKCSVPSLTRSESVIFRGVTLAVSEKSDADKGGLARSQSAPLKHEQVSNQTEPYQGPGTVPRQSNHRRSSQCEYEGEAPPIPAKTRECTVPMDDISVGFAPHCQPPMPPDPAMSVKCDTINPAFDVSLSPGMAMRSYTLGRTLPRHALHTASAKLANIPEGDSLSSSDLSEETLEALKTRSLPGWGRHAAARPLSTDDNLSELYAKVNFSKKRKNRMRHDSAAAIAMNKSGAHMLPMPFVHKDTDSLVDNEAVVVYDERTAL